MIKRFQSFIDKEFSNYPASQELIDLKDELVGVLMEKYTESIEAGKDDIDAYSEAVSSMSDLKKTYKNQMSALQFTPKEVVNKGKILLVVSLWYFVGLTLIFLAVQMIPSLLAVDWMPKYGTDGHWVVFPLGAFAYVIGLMFYVSYNSKLSKRKVLKRLTLFVVPIMLSLIAFFSLGFWAKMWHPSWLVFIAAAAIAVILDGFYAGASKKGNIIRVWIGSFLFFITLQLFLMLTVWPSAWVLYIVAAFIALVYMSIVMVKK
jgi:hypothetical protein